MNRNAEVSVLMKSLAIFGAACLLAACGNGTSASDAGGDDYYWALLEQNNPDNPEDSTLVLSASVAGDPIPNRITVKVDGKSPDSLVDFAFSYGRKEIRAYFNQMDWTKEHSIEMKSERGQVTGAVTVPDPITIAVLPPIQPLVTDSAYTLAWSGNADWYDVNTFCYSSGSAEPRLRDSITNLKSMVFPRGLFRGCNSVRFQVFGFNGPDLGSGKANLSGDGRGYLFSTNLDDQIRADADVTDAASPKADASRPSLLTPYQVLLGLTH